jgi:cobalt-zinc-cadmium efflux system membrane fusion protein
LRKRNHETEKSLYPKITTIRQLMEAETSYEEAKLRVRRAEQKLHTFGLSPAQIAAVKTSRDASTVLEVTAPFAGTVVDTSAVPGELGGPDRPIFGVAQMDRMWLVVDLYERDLARIESGQKVFFRVEGLRGKRFPGRLVAIGGEVDDRTRTVRVFADLKNVQGLLRANMFGRAEIRIRPPEAKLLVPRAAVQDDGDCQLVFVASGKDVYLPRKIELGAAYGVSHEVMGGLAAGENVVTTGSFLLKTEILRGQIGAG